MFALMPSDLSSVSLKNALSTLYDAHAKQMLCYSALIKILIDIWLREEVKVSNQVFKRCNFKLSWKKSKISEIVV